ncbi:cobalamin biosynthesis protein CbiX [Paenibacillus oenotherae]|uniref:Cobalamin biosynthesis protein CbiX n=1 Tax=Paenibacillus oenotherae TaxID=1435645 RepID=A0ABS7D4I7_9BACL|nr:CbiX/SirB N-terminal domain-containing protein [Paenibacillus oenotherae]MBW7474844.1 cobalamin biosynthesis protein CbiX [Paenibacillus oenotherae]
MKPGVLVISHGSREAQWVRLVDEAVAEVAEAIGQWPVGRDDHDSAALTMTSVPVVSSFLEIVEGRLIQDGIDRLAAEGVTDVYVLPLFVSSGSTHVDDIAQAFGLPPVSAAREGELAPFRLDGRADGWVGSGAGAAADNRGDCVDGPLRLLVHFGQPIDDDPEIAELLLSNIRELSEAPERERLLLVAHGSVEAGFYGRWRSGMTQLAGRLRSLGGFAGAEIAMLLPNQAACKLRVMLRKQPDSAVIVVPLFLSSGYFTRTVIPERLGELTYRYNGQSMLPHPCIARWMVRQIDGWLAGLVQQ